MKVHTTYSPRVHYVREQHWQELCDWCSENEVAIKENINLAGITYFEVLENSMIFELRWL